MIRSILMPLALAGLALAAVSAPASAKHHTCPALAALNHDRDQTLEWREARRAATRLFYRLDPDRDGTLDRNELRGRVGAISFARANPDRDGTLDLHEFLKLVKHRFHRANRDGDRTIECDELRTIRGKRLLKVLM
jgi:hypothetical protein